MPVAGGPYAFARRALGPWGGYLTGLAVTIEYVVAPAVIATGIGGKTFEEIDIETWDRVMTVNVRGTWLAVKALAPLLRRP